MTFHADEYQAAAGRYEAGCRTAGSGAPASTSPPCRWACGTTSVTTCRSSASRRPCAVRSTGASPTSTWRTTTARPTVRPSATSASIFARDFRPYRDELIISSKAGYDMWPGPYGQGGGSRKYLIASCDQSLARLGLDYVDIFYSHRFDETTPLEETMGALDAIVRSGRALYVGISSYSGRRTREAVEIARSLGTPLVIHQPSYSMLNRWIEEDLLDAVGETGLGLIAFSPLAQGMLTNKYLKGIPAGSRAAQGKSLDPSLLTDASLKHVRALDRMAKARGQSLAQMALAWALRDERVASVLVGASSVEQLDNSLDAVHNLDFSAEELAKIDKHAVDAGINLWKTSSDHSVSSTLSSSAEPSARRGGGGPSRDPTTLRRPPMSDTDYIPSPAGWVRKQVETIEATGDTRSVHIMNLPVVMLTMRGKKTGGIRKVPLMRVEHRGRLCRRREQGRRARAPPVVRQPQGRPADHPAGRHRVVAGRRP